MWQTIGHQKIKQQLEIYLQSGQIPHAILLSGPSAIGKTTLLNEFTNKLTEQASLEIKKYENDGKSLKISEARQLINQAYISTPHDYRIFLIEAIERLTLPASNSLLKIIEEPPNKVIFLATTNAIDQLPITILSRFLTLKTHNLTADELKTYAQTICNLPQLDPEQAAACQQKPGRLHQLIFNEGDTINKWQNLINQLNNPQTTTQLAAINAVSQEPREQVINFLKMLLNNTRLQLRQQTTKANAYQLYKIQKAIDTIDRNGHIGLTLSKYLSPR